MDKTSNRIPSKLRRKPQRSSTPLRPSTPETQSDQSAMDINASQTFASVHRPRHASMAAMKRANNQAVYNQHPFPAILQQQQHEQQQLLISDATMKMRTIEGSRALPHSMPVSIPHPYSHPFPQQHLQSYSNTHQLRQPPLPVPYYHHQQQQKQQQQQQQQQQQFHSQSPIQYQQFQQQQQHHHHQQQQQQQQKLVQHQSRIPTVQNFNQISKTATNLLNNIYEKHLLSQTTFENVNMVANNCASENNSLTVPSINPELNFSVTMQQQQIVAMIAKRREFNQPVGQSQAPIYEDIDENIKKVGHHQRPLLPKNIPANQIYKQRLVDIQNFNNEIGNYQKHQQRHGIEGTANIQHQSTGCESPAGRVGPVGGNLDKEEINCVFNNVGSKFEYRNSKINIMLETAQAMAAAAYFARAAQAQKMSMNSGGGSSNVGGGTMKSRATEISGSDRGGYCGALQRAPPLMPAAILRRLANRENAGLGKVKVMLRISDNPVENTTPSYMSIDKKKRQVTLSDPSTLSAAAAVTTSAQERAPMVAAPKMFAFDGLFTTEDSQTDVCSSALSEVIPAVLDGSDGCLLALGHPGAGHSKTMMGSISSTYELGAIPCAISWLYKGINERRQKSGARFSVRVSALGVSATKPGSSSRDLLAAHATESDESPGVYLRDDFLGGPTELRAPTAERAALFLDAALAGRSQGNLEPALIFTLHVYQYSLAGKGGVAGGRSRLHLIDLGGCANRSGGLPLSGIGNVLLAILSGQRHPPNRDHPLTPLLKDCLAPLTCHVAVLAHVSYSQTHSDALTTIQLASRIHRMRRRKHRFPLAADKTLGLAGNTGHQSGGSSEGPDPSSSDLSADTVIYMGPCDDQTDGEHPPVYLPSLSSGDNRCAMGKVLKGSVAEKPSKLPAKKSIQKPQSPIPSSQRTDSLKRNQKVMQSEHSYQNIVMATGSPIKQNIMSTQKAPTSPYKYPVSVSKGSNVPTPKGSPLRRPNIITPQDSPVRTATEEKWIDGPRVSRSKVAEARHLMREINHVKQCETWVDGPKTSAQNRTLVAGLLPGSTASNPGYGFMDNHKKTMIRQWVENQTSQVFPSGQVNSSPSSPHHRPTYHMTQFKISRSEDDQRSTSNEPINVIMAQGSNNNDLRSQEMNAIRLEQKSNQENEVHSDRSVTSSCDRLQANNDGQEEEDQDSGPSEVPPALPLIDRLGSREISHESLHLICSRHVSRESLRLGNVQTMDCGLQVTEEEIAKTMGCEHPLSALSHGDMSVVSSFHVGDTFSDCVIGDNSRHQFDQLARLREIFTSQLAMAEVTPVFRIGDAGSVYSEPAYRFNAGPGSVCSEPAYRPPSPRCRGCRQSITLSRSPSQTSLPSLNGIVTIAGMEQYASLRHPDGASDPNLQKTSEILNCTIETDEIISKQPPIDFIDKKMLADTPLLSQTQLPSLPPLPLSTPEAYDSGHDSTPRTSKHSGISRRAESGYHSVATVRDSDESSFGSAGSRAQKVHAKKNKRGDKSLCHWLRNPFTCTYPDTEGEISDF